MFHFWMRSIGTKLIADDGYTAVAHYVSLHQTSHTYRLLPNMTSILAMAPLTTSIVPSHRSRRANLGLRPDPRRRPGQPHRRQHRRPDQGLLRSAQEHPRGRWQQHQPYRQGEPQSYLEGNRIWIAHAWDFPSRSMCSSPPWTTSPR